LWKLFERSYGDDVLHDSLRSPVLLNDTLSSEVFCLLPWIYPSSADSAGLDWRYLPKIDPKVEDIPSEPCDLIEPIVRFDNPFADSLFRSVIRKGSRE